MDQVDMAAMARKTYASYLAISAEVLADGGSNVDRLSGVVTSDELQRERKSYRSLQQEHLHGSGSAKLLKFKVQQYDSEKSELTAYACVDLSSTRVIDSSGADVTASDRLELQTSLPTFALEEGSVKVKEDAEWHGNSIC